MRMRVNRLVYVLIGAALAVGLLMSAFMRPEARLTASEDCYGLCPSVTALSLSSSSVTYGNEQVEKFSVQVSAGGPGTGVPTGYVVVESGTKILCSVHLNRGKGSCSPAAKALVRGSYTIVAHYSGDKNFKPSTSSRETLAVLRHSFLRNPSVTALSLSSSRVSYGNERVEKFSVKVSAGALGGGVPTGYVEVASGIRTLCSIHLDRGKGSCSPAAKALARGSYTIVANYGGDKNFKPSASSQKTLTVLRH
jgi:Bacterial Ig-like domain (group 3)